MTPEIQRRTNPIVMLLIKSVATFNTTINCLLHSVKGEVSLITQLATELPQKCSYIYASARQSLFEIIN
jgi:hypothetical protein